MTTLLKVLGIAVAVLAALLAAAWLALRGPEIPFSALEAKYAGIGSGHVDLPNGVRLHFEQSGPTSAPVVVLLHGYGDSFTTWERWAPILAAQNRVIAIDLPGHGLTRAPDGYTLSTAGLVETLDQFATRHGLERFALVGNSLGGDVAWDYALKHPARVSALVLVDAAGWPQKPSGNPPLAFRILRYPIGRWLLAHIDNRPLIEQGVKAEVHDPTVITTAFIDRWAELQRAPGHRAILMSLAPNALAVATAADLAMIRAPTLILHGADDPLISPDSGRAFAAAIPGATLTLYPDVGHLPQVEIPERSARDVAAFLAAHSDSP